VGEQQFHIHYIFITLCLAFFLFFFPAQIKADVVIIGHPDIDIDTITRSKLKAIYTGQIITWSDGSCIRLITMKNCKIHKEFTRDYLKKTETQFKRWWRRKLFCGEGSMPVSLNTEEEMISFIARTKGAIGYVSKIPAEAHLKTISVIEE